MSQENCVPKAPNVFDTTSDCALRVSAASPCETPPAGRLPGPAVPGEVR